MRLSACSCVTVNVTVARCDPSRSPDVVEQTFRVPLAEGMTVLHALDYIYEHLDATLAYGDHGICAQGVCRRCQLLVDGVVVLACRQRVSGDVRVAPPPRFRVLRDLVYERRRSGGDATTGANRVPDREERS